jgi:hypothetical protein
LVNLANIYFDLDRDTDAKALLDKAVFLDANNRTAHKGLAFYWFRQHNYAMFRQELLKAATFKGIVRKKKDKKQEETTDEKLVKPGDSIETMETKLDKLKDSVPLTTADIIEDEFPAPARQIRNKYGKLAMLERMKMPSLPPVNTSSNQEFARGYPVIQQWVESFGEKLGRFQGRMVGVDTTAPEKVQDAQADAAAKAALADATELVRQAAAAMANIPGVTDADLAELTASLKELEGAAREQGAKVSDEPTTPATLGWKDSGGLFSDRNWCTYERIYISYGFYFKKYWEKYDANVKDIVRVYGKKVKDENERHRDEMVTLGKEHDQEGAPHGDLDLPCVGEKLRHKRNLNEIGDNSYRQWVNVHIPQYVQKMKPMMQDFWYVCTLYIKNMNDPKMVKREYLKMVGTYASFANRAVGNIGIGDTFKYEGPTDEEEEALRRAIKAAEEQAKLKKPLFEQATKVPETDWSKWIEDHLEFEVSGQFLSFKISARTIEFEAWCYGPAGRVKFDVVDGTMETWSGITAKFDVGIKVGGVEIGKVEARMDLVGGYSKWDFENGKFSEGWQPLGKEEAKIGLGPASLSGEVEIDPELNVKTTVKGTLSGSKDPATDFTILWESQ